MQDQRSGQVQVLGGTRVMVPAVIVDWVRRAAYAEIGSAAEALDMAAFASDREAHREWFSAPAERLRETYALLDAIGWSRMVPPLAVQIDLRRDGWGLVRALAGALEFVDEDVSEVERAGVLWDCIATAQGCIDALAVQEGAAPVLDMAA